MTARTPLAPGESRPVTMKCLLCKCARCGHVWFVTHGHVLAIDVTPLRPERCPGPRCKRRGWWHVARPRKTPLPAALDETKGQGS